MSLELYYYKVRSNQFRKYGSRKKIRNEDQCLSEVFKIKVIDLRLKQMMERVYDLLAGYDKLLPKKQTRFQPIQRQTKNNV